MSRRLLGPLIAACLLAVPFIALKVDRLQALFIPDNAVEAKLLDALVKNGFDTNRGVTADKGALIRAHRGTCDLELHEVSALGWDRSTIKKQAGDRRVTYIYDGAVFRDQPVWRTWSYFHFRRLAFYVGWSLAKRQTFAAISSGTCDDSQWRELSASAFHLDPSVSPA